MPSLRVLIAPQEFKGSLTGEQAASAIASGVRAAAQAAGRAVEARELPVADGGPGTVAIVRDALDAAFVTTQARGPLGVPLETAYAYAAEAEPPLAVIEAAATAGLVLVPEPDRDPMRASTFGTGEQIRDALARGARRLIVGVGGTGTNDGGAGAAQALGLRLLDANGEELPSGGLALARLARIDASAVESAMGGVELRIAVDVTNPLLGARGATAVYGPQKGVVDWQAPALEMALARWAERCRADLGVDVAALEGAGAGGGLPAGLVAVARAGGAEVSIESGAALVAEAIGLRAAVEASDLVVTGEGTLDSQTAYGKSVAHVASLAAEARVDCLAVAGRLDLDAGALPDGVGDAEPAAPPDLETAEAMRRAEQLVAAAAERLLTRYLREHAGS